MEYEKLYTLAAVYEDGNPALLMLLDESALAISNDAYYLSRLIYKHSYLKGICEVEAIPVHETAGEAGNYTAAAIQRNYDEEFNFPKHLYVSINSELLNKLEL